MISTIIEKIKDWCQLNHKWHSSWPLVKRIVNEYAKPQWMTILGAVTCMILVALSTAASAKLIQPIIDDIFHAKSRSRLFEVCVFVLVTFGVKGLANYGESVLLQKVGLRIIATLQQQLVGHFINSDVGFFAQISTGEVTSRIMNDVWFLRNSITKGLIGIFKNLVTLVFLIALMVYEDWLLAVIALLVFPLAILPIVKIGRSMRKLSHSTQEELGNFANFLTELFRGIRVVKSYVTEEFEKSRAARLIDKIYKLNLHNTKIVSSTHPVMETLGGVAIVIVIAYGGVQVIESDQSAGGFFSFLAALLLAYEPVKSLAQLNTSLQEGLAGAVRIFQMLEERPQIVSPARVRSFDAYGAIQFNEVTFAYSGMLRKVLEGLNLSLAPAATTALVGFSGSGKSTILNLIPRFYDVEAGAITIGGVDIRQVDLSELRRKIAIVSQEVVLFNTTVKQNILYGDLGANEEAVRQAAIHADAHDFIMELPHGYDTIIGENGIQLSGGQRQRIAIARAILKNAPILLLDEATSSLDTKAEQNVHQALDELMLGRTTLVVAHRLSTVVKANKIYVIHNGAIMAEGTHEELLASCEFYQELCRSQFMRAAAAV